MRQPCSGFFLPAGGSPGASSVRTLAEPGCKRFAYRRFYCKSAWAGSSCIWDDAEFARHQLARLNAGTADCPQATHWIQVAGRLLTQVSAGLLEQDDAVTAVLTDGRRAGRPTPEV